MLELSAQSPGLRAKLATEIRNLLVEMYKFVCRDVHICTL